MDTKQFEAMLSDAEIRLRRLKVLYDQWFVGIERTEPAIPKKELEDLLLRLRREQPTNTALKFRLQQLVQRHMTFTTYWRRIGRQIEDGTFKRDLVRARKQKKRGPEDDADANYEIDVELELDMDMDMDAALADATEASERVVPAAAKPAAPEKPAKPAAVPLAAPAPAAAAPAAGPALGAPLAPPAAAGRAPVPGAPPKLAVPPPVGAPKAPPPSAAGAKPAAGAAPVVPPAAAAAAAAVVRQIKGATAPGAAAPANPQPAAAAAKLQPPAAAAKPQPPAAAAKPQPPAAAAKPQPPAAAAKPPVAAPRVAAGGEPKNGAQPVLSSEDVQRIYSNYVAARKQNAERTDNVKLDNIEKTLRGMLPSLEKKHAGKKIDFEVVVKDGKVALKPVAK